MEKKTEEMAVLIEKAVGGDRAAMEAVVSSVQDLVFNLSLRMLGTFADAEDAAQDILLKVIAHLPSFRGESAFSTWVFRIAANHLKDYKKHLFANSPLNFEYYGNDIKNGGSDAADPAQDAERAVLAEELKLSCTNVMLQCLDAESRCIFILGTMFKIDSCTAGEILGLSPQAYRQRLSRIRKKMADFLSEYCGEYGSGTCRCRNRISYAVQNHRINPVHLEYSCATEIPLERISGVKSAMEEIDGLAQQFTFGKLFAAPEQTKQRITEFLRSAELSIVKNA